MRSPIVAWFKRTFHGMTASTTYLAIATVGQTHGRPGFLPCTYGVVSRAGAVDNLWAARRQVSQIDMAFEAIRELEAVRDQIAPGAEIHDGVCLAGLVDPAFGGQVVIGTVDDLDVRVVGPSDAVIARVARHADLGCLSYEEAADDLGIDIEVRTFVGDIEVDVIGGTEIVLAHVPEGRTA